MKGVTLDSYFNVWDFFLLRYMHTVQVSVGQAESQLCHLCGVLGLLSPLSAYFYLINVTQMLCLPIENLAHLHDFSILRRKSCDKLVCLPSLCWCGTE